MSELYDKTYNPDVLSCLANLSNDEVFTPPEVANQMLDMLPKEIWSDPDATFLDPACKSGVFLREIAKRLIKGLEDVYPDLDERLEHIFKKQLYGVSITELTSLLSRRGVYCSKYPNSKYSVVEFDQAEGNIRFRHCDHVWVNGKCKYCGASQGEYDREDGLETHAYEFVHQDNPKGMFPMRFDVIAGNPPYQLSTGQGQSQAKPIYHLFVQQAKKLNPKYLTMITPSRWMTGGMGLDSFRKEMLSDNHLKEIVDYSMSRDCFPSVDIAGGISYFLWDRSYQGDCSFTYNNLGESTNAMRKLNEYPVFVRDNRAIEIVHAVTAQFARPLSDRMSSLGPFGLGTAERGHSEKKNGDYILLSSAGRSWISPKQVENGISYIKKWKTVLGKASSAGAATADKNGQKKVIATIDVLEPDAVCTFSYFIAGDFETENEANNLRDYLKTKFVRFLLLQSMSGININRERFHFVPDMDFRNRYTDEDLYELYGLSDEQSAYIEKTIKPMVEAE